MQTNYAKSYRQGPDSLGFLKTVSMGILGVLVPLALGLTLLSLLVSEGFLPITWIAASSKFILGLAFAIGAYWTVKHSVSRKLICAAAVGGICFLILALVCVAWKGRGGLSALPALLIGSFATGFGSLLGVRQKKNRYF